MEIIKKLLSNKKVLIGLIASLVVVGGVCVYTGYVKGSEINYAMYKATLEEIGPDTAQRIQNIENRISGANFITKLFVKKSDDYNKMINDYNQYVNTTAQAVVDKINALEVKTKLYSYDEYNQTNSSYKAIINEVKDYIDDNKVFGNEVKSKITNYNLVEQYSDDLAKLLESYAHRCSSCGGDGKNSRTCSSCNGRGKKLVTWYSHGDWGETSYSSYKCTSCNGSGRKTYSCGSCKSGKIYTFETPEVTIDTTVDTTVDTNVNTNADTAIGNAY